MTRHHALFTFTAATFLAAAAMTAARAAQSAPLAMDTVRVTITGTSNIHPYTASTDVVRLTRIEVATPIAEATFWDDILKPGALAAFDVTIPAATLSSPKAGLDKNMHKALKVDAHRDITFKLARLERGATGALMAVGALQIAGVEREVVIALKTERRDANLVVKGEVPLLMTDFGIKPPTAMLGMLKTDPKVTVSFETVLSVPRT